MYLYCYMYICSITRNGNCLRNNISIYLSIYLNDFRDSCSHIRYKLVNVRSEYKATLRNCKSEYDIQQYARLEML